VKARLGLEGEDLDGLVCEANDEELAALATFRNFAYVETLHIGGEKFGLRFVQKTIQFVQFEIDKLAAFDENDNLPSVGACHQYPTLLRLPLRALSTFAVSLDLHQALLSHLDQYVAFEETRVQGGLVGLETRISDLGNFVLRDLKDQRRFGEGDDHELVVLVFQVSFQRRDS